MTTTIFVSITDILAWIGITLCILTLFTLWVIETIKKHIKRNERRTKLLDLRIQWPPRHRGTLRQL